MFEPVSKVTWQKAASPSCHPSRRRMDSFATCAGQAHSQRVGTFPCRRPAYVLPQKCTFSSGSGGPHRTHGSLNSQESAPPPQKKRHLGRLSRFAHLSPVCPTHRKTHRHTDHAMCDICNNRPQLVHCTQVMRPKISSCIYKSMPYTKLNAC